MIVLPSNLGPVRRVYLSSFYLNRPTVAELAVAVAEALGRPLGRDAADAAGDDPAGMASRLDGMVELVDGERYVDQWLRDEFVPGYRLTEEGAVAIHCPRGRELGPWVRGALAESGIELVGDFPGGANALSYGGNLEVAPPVAVATPALAGGPAGPPVPAQEPAPYGKVLIGAAELRVFDWPGSYAAGLDAGEIADGLRDAFAGHGLGLPGDAAVAVLEPGRMWELSGTARRFRVEEAEGRLAVWMLRQPLPAYQAFLEAELAQPLVPIDTSWLAVGHVDAVVALVPASGGRGFRLLVASPALAVEVLEAAQALHREDPMAHPLTALFRGQRRVWHRPQRAAITVERVLARQRDFNLALQEARLAPIEARLQAALDLGPEDIVRMPVLFGALPLALMPRLGTVIDAGGKPFPVRTAAYTPNPVNALVVGRHVVVARPFGPRMRAVDVASILGVPEARVAGRGGHWHWARHRDKLEEVAAAFDVPAAAIAGHPANAGKLAANGQVERAWVRLAIPEATVDLLEAAVAVALEDLGLTAHFVDDWDWYHQMEGEVRCATNAVRAAPQGPTGHG